MDLYLRNKHALVTGASQGIGMAIASALAAEGCHLHLAARTPQTLQALADRLRREHAVQVHTHAADLATPAGIEAVSAACQDVDILVNNAGAIPRGSILEVDDAAWRQSWELKVFGYLNLTRALYARMVERRAGVILNIIGIGAERLDYGYAAGSMGNAALVALTRTIGGVSLDLGVRVLGLSPGWVETEKAKRTMRRRAATLLGDENRWPEMAKEFPRGKLIDPQEVADVAAFLCSPRAGGMSGHIVTVDAGFASRGYPPPQAGTN
jgi:hypothetical protein